MERRPLLLLLLRKQSFVEGQSQPTPGPGMGLGKDIKKQQEQRSQGLV